jgi:hypothetical protein
MWWNFETRKFAFNMNEYRSADIFDEYYYVSVLSFIFFTVAFVNINQYK